MYTMALSCFFAAMLLSRCFKFYILFPTSFVAIAVVLIRRSYEEYSLLQTGLDAMLQVASLQVGYLCGLLAPLIRLRSAEDAKIETDGSMEPASPCAGHKDWRAAP